MDSNCAHSIGHLSIIHAERNENKLHDFIARKQVFPSCSDVHVQCDTINWIGANGNDGETFQDKHKITHFSTHQNRLLTIVLNVSKQQRFYLICLSSFCHGCFPFISFNVSIKKKKWNVDKKTTGYFKWVRLIADDAAVTIIVFKFDDPTENILFSPSVSIKLSLSLCVSVSEWKRSGNQCVIGIIEIYMEVGGEQANRILQAYTSENHSEWSHRSIKFFFYVDFTQVTFVLPCIAH